MHIYSLALPNVIFKGHLSGFQSPAFHCKCLHWSSLWKYLAQSTMPSNRWISIHAKREWERIYTARGRKWMRSAQKKICSTNAFGVCVCVAVHLFIYWDVRIRNSMHAFGKHIHCTCKYFVLECVFLFFLYTFCFYPVFVGIWYIK